MTSLMKIFSIFSLVFILSLCQVACQKKDNPNSQPDSQDGTSKAKNPSNKQEKRNQKTTSDNDKAPRTKKGTIRMGGAVYKGEIQGGRPHGEGKFTYPDGSQYIGQFIHNEMIDDDAKFIYKNGNVYKGGVKKGHRHGQGKLTFKSGGYYQGEWKMGKRHGQGKNVYQSGGWYDGQWKNGQRQGWGTYVSSRGSKFVGQWKNGKKNGFGARYQKGDKIEKQGYWKKGSYQGLAPKGEKVLRVLFPVKVKWKGVSKIDKFKVKKGRIEAGDVVLARHTEKGWERAFDSLEEMRKKVDFTSPMYFTCQATPGITQGTGRITIILGVLNSQVRIPTPAFKITSQGEFQTPTGKGFSGKIYLGYSGNQSPGNWKGPSYFDPQGQRVAADF